jgi:hypothetical protein
MREFEQRFIDKLKGYMNLETDMYKINLGPFMLLKNDNAVKLNESIGELKQLLDARDLDFQVIYNKALELLQKLVKLDDNHKIGRSTAPGIRNALQAEFNMYQNKSSTHMNQLEKRDREKNATIIKLEADLKALSAEIEHKQSDLEKKNHDITNLQKELQTEIGQKDSSIAKLRNVRQASSEHVGKLKEKKKGCVLKVDELAMSKKALENKNRELEKSLDELKMRCQLQSTELDGLRGQHELQRVNAYRTFELENKLEVFTQLFIPLQFRDSFKFKDMPVGTLYKIAGHIQKMTSQIPSSDQMCQLVEELEMEHITQLRAQHKILLLPAAEVHAVSDQDVSEEDQDMKYVPPESAKSSGEKSESPKRVERQRSAKRIRLSSNGNSFMSESARKKPKTERGEDDSSLSDNKRTPNF